MAEINERLAALQIWLNSKRSEAGMALLSVDGQHGPALRSAIIETFRNKSAPAVLQNEINGVAARLGCTPTQLAAVAAVESAGGGWDDTGLLKALWERHYLWRRIKLSVPFLSDPNAGGYTVDADHDGINDSWEKLADASLRFGFGTAAECVSFGKFQIMGAWWKKLGYSDVGEFIWGMSRGEAAHYEALRRYIEVNNLRGAIQKIDGNPMNCKPFADGYNGPAQKGYDGRIAAAFRKLS